MQVFISVHQVEGILVIIVNFISRRYVQQHVRKLAISFSPKEIIINTSVRSNFNVIRNARVKLHVFVLAFEYAWYSLRNLEFEYRVRAAKTNPVESAFKKSFQVSKS